MTGERILPPASLSGAPVRTITTPFQFVFSGAENLRVRSANSLAGVVIGIQGRLLQSDGTITPFVLTSTPPSDRSILTQDFPLGPGTLLTLTAFAIAGAPQRGQTFVQVQVIQGLGGATITLGTLLQDYVTSFQQLAWPGSPIQNSLDGRGTIVRTTVAQPAPGALGAFSLPAGTRWRIQAVTLELDTSAVVATRKPYLQFVAGATVLVYYVAIAATVASRASFYSWTTGGNGGAQASASGASQWCTTALGPDTYMRGGDGCFMVVADIDAGDQLKNIIVIAEEWLELN